MPRTLVALTLFSLATIDASAQTVLRVSNDAARPSAVRSGRVDGTVRDEAGVGIKGASIVALGDLVASAQSGTDGRFSLVLQPGEYVLRVAHQGYTSSYREAIRIHSRARVEREITIVRQPAVPAVLTAGIGGATAATAQPAGVASSHSHSEAAWRLRHLPRSVLRDGNGTAGLFEPSDLDPVSRPGALSGRALTGPARLANAFFNGTDFTGQVNFLTTSALDNSSGWLPETWPRSIAYFSIGSVDGSLGDWQMRGSVGGGTRASWALVGEYRSPREAVHALHTGVSYSAQGSLLQRDDRIVAARPAARSVAGVYAYHRWSSRFAAVDYGVRLDRYDYIATPELLSPRAAGRVNLIKRLYVDGSASQRMIAPGAEEFLPPAAPGPWVPPERTFSALLADQALEAERVRHVAFGIGREFGSAIRPVHLMLRRVRQSSADQIATIFGLDPASGLGHYYVAAPGDVEIAAWTVQAGAWLTPRLEATVDYTIADAHWDRRPNAWRLRRSAASVVRRELERLHDLTMTMTADIAETSTHVTFVYRVNSAFSREDRGRLPVADGRFDVQVHQALPYQPIRGARLELLVAARTLFRELAAGASFYDELLTVAPPLRLIGGVQLRF